MRCWNNSPSRRSSGQSAAISLLQVIPMHTGRHFSPRAMTGLFPKCPELGCERVGGVDEFPPKGRQRLGELFAPDFGANDRLQVGKALTAITRSGVRASALDDVEEHLRVEFVFGPPSWSASVFCVGAAFGDRVGDCLLDGRGIFVRKLGSQTFPCVASFPGDGCSARSALAASLTPPEWLRVLSIFLLFAIRQFQMSPTNPSFDMTIL